MKEPRAVSSFLVSLAAICLVAPLGSSACPRRCACYVYTEVHCTFRYLTSIPADIPPSVERINFGYNSLARLTETDFSGLSKLELLMLHSNGIHTIADKTFSDLQALQVLKMSYNKVRTLQKDTFYGLKSLTRLHMDHNNLEFINPEVFYGLVSLRLVHLEGNQLTKLHPDTFVSLRYLQIFKISSIKYLYLSDNFLTSLPQEMVSYMPELESLYLHGNPWTCDCFLKWLSDWIQEKPDVVKCKKDRNPSSPQQCPLCMSPRISKGKPFAAVPAAAFLCVKPTIDTSLKIKSLMVPEDSGSASISPQDFMAPLGCLTFNLTDQSGNEANMVCSVQKPSRTMPIEFTEGNDPIKLNVPFSTILLCNLDDNHIQPLWQVLALYSDSPLKLERGPLLTETPQLCYKYKQVTSKPEDIFTSIEADLCANPFWLVQDQISLQLNRNATTLRTLQIQYSSDAQISLPIAETRPVRQTWTMIPRLNNTKLEHTVLVGGTIALDCPGQGEPTPHLEWLLADGSKVRAPYVSEDGRILIDKSGKLELQMADSFDTGVYHCISSNSDDVDILTYRITVVEPSVEAVHNKGVHHTVFVGETLDLPCHSTGIPDASISWVLPGNTVLYQSSGGKEILINGTLRILHVTEKDQGHYHCVAANPSGVDVLIFQVSVKIQGPRTEEQDGDTNGSGLDVPDSSIHLEDPLTAQLPTSAAVVGKAEKEASSMRSRHSYRESTKRQRGDSTRRRFREHRRRFPLSAQRIDPQHWAALLEKAKKNAMLQKQENSTASPPPLVTQLTKISFEEEESSGILSPDEEFTVLATKAFSAPLRSVATDTATLSHSVVTNTASGTEASPVVSPQILQPKATNLNTYIAITTTAMSKYTDQISSRKTQDTTNQNSTTVFPLLPGVTEFYDADPVRRDQFQSTLPPTGRTVVTDIHRNMLVSMNNKNNIVSESVTTVDGHEATETGVSESRSNHFHSHATQELSTSKLSSGPPTRYRFQIPRKNAAKSPLPRHFGRQRKIWSRGQIISRYRIPILRRHRYGIVRPTIRSASQVSTTTFSAPGLHMTCTSCPSSGTLASATAAQPFLGSILSPLPKADIPRVIAEESTTLVQNLSVLSENKPNVDIDNTTPTIKYFRSESVQVTPSGKVLSDSPRSVSMEKNHIASNGQLSILSTREGGRRPLITPPPSSTITRPSMPTSMATTRFSKRKIPWHQIFKNNPNQKGLLKNLHKFGLRKSKAPMFSKIAPDLPTDKTFPFRSTTLSARLMQVPPVTLAPTHQKITEMHGAGSLPKRKVLPVPPFYSALPSIPSKEPSAKSVILVQTATLSSHTALGFTMINRMPMASPVAQKDQRIKEPQARTDPNTFPDESSSTSTAATRTPPILTTAHTSIKPSVSAFTFSPLEDISRFLSTTGLHSRSPATVDGTEELLQENPQTVESTIASEITLPSTSLQTITVSPSTEPPLPSSSAPPLPTPTSLPCPPSVLTDSTATPYSKMANMAVKPQAFSRHDANPQQLVSELTAPPEAHSGAKFTTRTTRFSYSDLFHATPAPALVTAIKPQNSKWLSSPWPEDQFSHNSYSEVTEKSKKPTESITATLSLPEVTSQASNWNRQNNAKKGGFYRKPVQKTTPKFLPSESLSSNTFEKPKIVGGKAASFTVPADSDALLPCEAAGNPLPTIHWIRVPSGMDLSKRKQNNRLQVLPNGTLFIQRVSIQDRGQYLCSAANILGTDRLHVTLSVISYPPRILERPTKEMTVHSASTVELKCRAEGRPRPTTSWILANQTAVSESSEGKSRVQVTSEGTLVIHNITIYDRGFYKCLASNPAGQDSWLVKIQVIAAPPLILEQKRQNIVGSWGESLTIPCTARGNPQPSVHWVLADGTEVKQLQHLNSKLLLYPNGTLHIRNIASADRGTYECIATSSTGSERRVVIIAVREQEAMPRIKLASQKWTEVNFGDTLLLNCSATGEPKPKIIWRLPSKAVIDQWHRMGSRIHVYPNGTLLIRSVAEKDGGDYLCVARNRMGEDLVLMHVSLKLRPARIAHKQHLKKQVYHGKDFQVDCKASGSPKPEISWSLPDGTVVNNVMQADDNGYRTKRYTLFDNGTLYFNKVGVTEEGDYTCYAQNTLGKDEMKVHLTVVTTVPRIRQGSKTTVRIRAGATAVLDCEVTGEPKPQIFWLLPSSDMISFSNDRYTIHTNGSLSINTAKLLDSGEYVCVARNPSGDDTKMYKLEVVSRPPLINGLYRNRSVIKATAVRHSKKHLDCRAEGMPTPQIMWIMPDNIFLTAPYYGSRITVYKNGTLEIRNIRLSDSADFICVARNEGGESVLVVRLEVQEMLRRPTFRSPFNEKVVAQLGKSTALNCSVDGNPPPEIIWILPNGTRLSSRPQNSQYLIPSNGSFIIYKTTRNNAGKYRCAARNKVGYIEKLIILEIGQKPVILTYALGTVRSISGESLSLHCVSDGIPKPNVKWITPSGYEIDRPQVNRKYTLHENGTLVIKGATVYDKGNYICQAQNSVGHEHITIPVMIVAYPPRITNRPPRSILTRTGTAFQLHCVALGVPKPEITWEMPGHSPLLLKESKRRTLGSALPPLQGTLLIQNPQTSDSGIYKCIAKNPLGSDYATTYIQVI
ncbi:immunoglobulin superfamily member 10 [Ctenodactylus gundi]